MYLEYFKLKEFPFLSSPDSRFLYLADQVNETFQKCLYMLSNRIGPVYTSGPIGAGKTTLSSRLQQQLEQEKKKYRLLLDSRVVDLPMSYNPIAVTLSSLK